MKKPVAIFRVAFAFGILFSTLCSAQSMQKWKTPDGGIYFGNNPPPGSEDIAGGVHGSASRPSTAEATSEGLHELAMRYVNDAKLVLLSCKLSRAVVTFTERDRDEVFRA
jgi:hypothetical protein